MHSRHINGVTKLQPARSASNPSKPAYIQPHIYQLSPDVPDDLHPSVHIQISCLGRKHCTSSLRSKRMVKTETLHRLCYIQAQTSPVLVADKLCSPEIANHSLPQWSRGSLRRPLSIGIPQPCLVVLLEDGNVAQRVIAMHRVLE